MPDIGALGSALGAMKRFPPPRFAAQVFMELIGGRLGGVAGIYRDSKRVQ
jgi:hypothetical protein